MTMPRSLYVWLYVWPSMAALLLLLLGATAYLTQSQWQQDLSMARNASERELGLLASLARNDLQRGGYQDISATLQEWGASRPDIVSLRLQSGNGFLLSAYRRNRPGKETLDLATDIRYSYAGEARLSLARDLGPLREKHRRLMLQLGAAYLVLAGLLIALTRSMLLYRRESDSLRERSQELNRANTDLRRVLAGRQQAESERDRLASIMEAAPDLVSLADPNGHIIYLNEAGRTLTGVGHRDLGDLKIPVFHPKWAAELIQNEALPAAIRDGHWSGETALFDADGEEVPTAQLILSHRDGQGRPQYFSTIIRDLRRQKQAEAELDRYRASLEQMVEARTVELKRLNLELESFTYSVSHDLRGPLRGIDGFAQALLEEYGDRLDQAGRDYLDRVRKGSQRMGELIDDLLRLAQVSRASLQVQPVDLGTLAESVLANLRAAQPERKIDTAVAPGLRAQGDPGLLRAALENLLGNAWKYTAKTAEPRIEFGADTDGGETVYFVRDNGVGFDMAHAGKLFGAFQRLHGRDEFEGTGIGLATVRRIVERHGGRVWAKAAPEKGATFHFTLPELVAEPARRGRDQA